MKKILLFSLLLFAQHLYAIGSVITISSPINYQTVIHASGDLKINFRVNATALFVIPEDVVLYINNTEQKRVKVNSTTYFLVTGMPPGKYVIRIGAYAHDKRPVAWSDEVRFTMSHKHYVTVKK